ncbi:Gfo/Idh/MocA family oxidoreductase [Sphingobacterium sp. SG20118]|uniref:Gfo/Idh/MocA family oxidoreductase n=1 Tax=Sphingobacterium sp. SG20118 TaxID=3367156 RepID=UPI0037DFC542
MKNGVDPQEALLRAGAFPDEDSNWGEEDPSIYGKLNLLWNGEDVEEIVPSKRGSYPDYYQNIADAILGRASLIVTAEQGRDVIRIIELGMQSQEERRVVSLDDQLIAY